MCGEDLQKQVEKGATVAEWDVTIKGELGGVLCINTLQVLDIGGGGGPFDSVAKRVGDTFLGTVMLALCDEYSLKEVQAIEIGGGAESIETYDDQANVSEASLTVNCCLHIRKVSGGVANNGRWYLPGGQESQVGPNGIVGGTYRAVVQTRVDEFLADLALADLQMTIQRNEVGSFPSDVVGLQVRPFIARQSRRLDRARSQ